MVKFCTNCGGELHEGADICTNCGKDLTKDNISTSNNSGNINNNSGNFRCPRCGSNNVSVQVVNESSLVTKHHGCFWWVCVGWWWIAIKWLFLTVPALFFAIFVGKRKKIKNTTKKIKVCQNCGQTW